MPPRVYDTGFFVELFYSRDAKFLGKLKEDLRSVRERKVSAVTIHETYKIVLENEGRDLAELRCSTIERDFDVVDMSYDIAVQSAELRSKYRIPLADSVIAATAQRYGCPVITDDPHFEKIKEVETRWY